VRWQMREIEDYHVARKICRHRFVGFIFQRHFGFFYRLYALLRVLRVFADVYMAPYHLRACCAALIVLLIPLLLPAAARALFMRY